MSHKPRELQLGPVAGEDPAIQEPQPVLGVTQADPERQPERPPPWAGDERRPAGQDREEASLDDHRHVGDRCDLDEPGAKTRLVETDDEIADGAAPRADREVVDDERSPGRGGAKRGTDGLDRPKTERRAAQDEMHVEQPASCPDPDASAPGAGPLQVPPKPTSERAYQAV